MSGGYATTPYFALKKPITGADDDQWGTHWNQNADTLDATLKVHGDALAGVSGGPFLPTTGGSLNGPGNLVVGGTLGVTGATTHAGTVTLSGLTFMQLGDPLGTNNGIQFRPAVAGSNPFLQVTGPDTNRSLQIVPKGTGQLQVPRINMGGPLGNGLSTALSAIPDIGTSPLWINSFFTGTNANTSNQNFNTIIVNDNVTYPGTGASNALLIQQNSQANAVNAGGLWVSSRQIAAPINPFRFSTALTAASSVSYNCSGTALVPGLVKGAATALSTYSSSTSGATFIDGIVGYEMDIHAQAGSSLGTKTGLLIVLLPDDVVSGAFAQDCAISFGGHSAANGWDYMVRFGGTSGQIPYKTTATLIGAGEAQDPTNGQAAAAWGIDLSGVRFSGGFVKSTGYAVDGAGAVTSQKETLGNWSLTPSSAGLAVDAIGQRASLTSIANGGGGWAVGDRVVTAQGGVYQVTAITNLGANVGPATVVTELVAGVSASPPSNPVATTAANNTIFRTVGAGLTLNLAWSAANVLSLQPSGGTIRLPGIPASASYANDAAAATAGVPVGQVYRNGSVLQVRVA